MANCLYECLKEAHLERYYKNFTIGGLTSCDALIGLSMQQYPEYGIVSMDDRLKLFKLIQIVKSVQSEGLSCQHDGRNAAKNDKKVTYKNPAQKITVKSVNSVSDVQRNHSVKQVSKENINNKLNPAKVKYRPAHKDVVYRKGSDSPVFHCRKTLNFSNLDVNSSDEDQQVTCQAKELDSKQKTHATFEPAALQLISTQEEGVQLKSTPMQHVPRSFFIPVDKTEVSHPTPPSSIATESSQPVVKQPMMYTAQEQAMTTNQQKLKPFQFRSFQPSSSSKDQHAYFPASNETKKETPVERIFHSNGYNYGLPQELQKDKLKMTPSKNSRTKICVCVRKRPLVPREVKRSEADIVKTAANSAVIVDEAKVAVDLTKYIQQVGFY